MIVGDHLVKVYSMSRRDVKRGASIENSRIVKSVKFSVLTPILHILDISGGVTGPTRVGFEGHTLEISNQYARLRGCSGTDSDQMPPALS